MSPMTYTKDMSIFEALERDPEARAVFESHGMACCLCIGAQSESIEAAPSWTRSIPMSWSPG